MERAWHGEWQGKDERMAITQVKLGGNCIAGRVDRAGMGGDAERRPAGSARSADITRESGGRT